MQHRASRPFFDAWRRLPGVAARRIALAAGRAPTRALAAVVAVAALGAGGFGVVASVSDGTAPQQAEPPVAGDRDPGQPAPATDPSESGRIPDPRNEESSAPPSSASPEPSRTGGPSPTSSGESGAVPTPDATSATPSPPSPPPVASRTGGDRTAPETTLAADYPEPDAATFSFSADESASFTCSLDGAAFTACSSPVQYADVDPGWHTIAVRATDGAGNVDASPARARWLATRGDTGGGSDQ